MGSEYQRKGQVPAVYDKPTRPDERGDSMNQMMETATEWKKMVGMLERHDRICQDRVPPSELRAKILISYSP